MMLRAIIIDDEQKGIDALKILIEKFVTDVKVVAETTAAEEGLELVESYKPEIVFLDINMPAMNGFELLERLSWRDFNLVFITAHQEFALKALKNNAIDYLLKPIDHEDLVAAIYKIRKNTRNNDGKEKFNYHSLLESLSGQQRQKIIINSRTGIESLDAQDIILFESASNYTKIALTDREIIASKTLKEFDQQLCTEHSDFMRVHHSFIVNLNKVVRYLKSSEHIVMSNEAKVPVAKSRRDAFFKWMNV
jgi:two-component system, LytTR family, response regulator